MADSPAGHERLGSLTHADGELTIGGEPVSRLALRAGQTPFYAYDRAHIAARLEALRAALPRRVEIHYAIKANPYPALLGFIRPLVDGLDVASENELRVALDSGMPPAEISFAGPAKRPAELACAIGAGICVNCESETEIERLAEASRRLGLPGRAAIRVNPDFELKGAGMKMSGSPKQFGIDAARVPDAIRQAIDAGLEFEGLHIFCGSQNLRTDAIVEANLKTLGLAAELVTAAGAPCRVLNIGGGYGIPYFPGETSIDLDAVGAALESTLAGADSALADTRIVVELGRYIVGEAGYYVCRVQDIKESQGQRFVMVDGGLHHHLSNSGNFGQVLRKNYPVVIANRMDEPTAGTVSIVGPLCTPLDIVASQIETPEVAIGDLVAVMQSGAYGFTASPERFLDHPGAVQLLV